MTNSRLKLKLFGALWLALGAAGSVCGQDGRLQIDSLNSLEAKSVQTVDVSVDGSLLQIATKFLSEKDPDEARAKAVIGGIKGIYVKRYEFEQTGAYAETDVNPIRSQLTAPAWTRMVTVRSKRPEQENVDVYTLMQGEKVGGMAVIVAEPKALTVVNIVGMIDLEKLAELNGKMGIPHLDIDFGDKNNSRPKKE